MHYLASDLDAGAAAVWQSDNAMPNGIWASDNGTPTYPFPVTPNNIVNGQSRYQPWGKTAPTALQGSGYNFSNPDNLIYKDPLVWSPDYWDFPTNKFPTVGWLGRVHRGTPWQTVYLKSGDVLHTLNTAADINTWRTWTGDGELTFGQYFDAANSAPVQDRLLFDLFTTGLNDNATRGQLSVNVGAGSSDPTAGLAAWSAVFSGIVVPPISPTNTYSIISPAGTAGMSSPLGQLVQGIYNTRTNTTLFPQQVFGHVGDILAVPQMTQQSPFLNVTNTTYNNDEMYEWLPQQVMSLLRVGSSPRYVIYSWGQALKPAPGGVVTGSSFFGMVTNYQVVAETATRAVVRFDSTLTNIIINGTPALSVTNNKAVIESFNILPPD